MSRQRSCDCRGFPALHGSPTRRRDRRGNAGRRPPSGKSRRGRRPRRSGDVRSPSRSDKPAGRAGRSRLAAPPADHLLARAVCEPCDKVAIVARRMAEADKLATAQGRDQARRRVPAGPPSPPATLRCGIPHRDLSVRAVALQNETPAELRKPRRRRSQKAMSSSSRPDLEPSLLAFFSRLEKVSAARVVP